MDSLRSLNKELIRCEKCPRLRTHCAKLARTKRRAYKNEQYWGKPVPGFGAPNPDLWIVGLAPGAHGANRTGRVFTGDSSGDWLYPALFRYGFSSIPSSISKQDGLILKDTYISCICRCAPPENRPLPEEIRACHSFLIREWSLLHHPSLILALGKIAFDQVIRLLMGHYQISKDPRWLFKHLAEYKIGTTQLMASYHPSRQNTSTGRLTLPMWNKVFQKAKEHLENHSSSKN